MKRVGDLGVRSRSFRVLLWDSNIHEFKSQLFITSLDPTYRVNHDDFYFSYFTLLDSPRADEILAEWAEQPVRYGWNIQVKVNPTQVREVMVHRVYDPVI